MVGSYTNEMWMFDPSIGQWATMIENSLSGTGNGEGVYQAADFWQQINTPGYRQTASSWTDSQGNFWMFGGYGLASALPPVTLNDLWQFKPAIDEWAWMGGSSTTPCLLTKGRGCAGAIAFTYGALGSSTAGSIPGSRNSAATWTDSNGNLWMFGGEGFVADGDEGFLSDMWEYNLSGSLTEAAPLTAAAAPPSMSVVAGSYTSPQTLSLSDATPGTMIYYTTDGTNPTSASPVYSAPLTISGTETVAAIAVASNEAVSPLTIGVYTLTSPQAAAPTFSVPGGTYDSTQTVAITDASTAATIHYTTDGSTPNATSTIYSGDITVSATETLNAIAVASGYANSLVAIAAYTIMPTPTFTLQATPSSITVSSGGQGTTTLTLTPKYGFNSTVSFTCSGLPVGESCAFSPASITPSGGQASSVVTISTNSLFALRRPNSFFDPRGLMLAVTVIVIVSRHRRLKQTLLLTISCIGLQMAAGSGGGSTSGGSGTGPVTSTVTIVATAGTIQQTTPTISNDGIAERSLLGGAREGG